MSPLGIRCHGSLATGLFSLSTHDVAQCIQAAAKLLSVNPCVTLSRQERMFLMSAAMADIQPKPIAVRGHLSCLRVCPVVGLQKMGLGLEVFVGLSFVAATGRP